MGKIGVVSLRDDIHCRSVCHLAEQRSDSIFHFESDNLADRPASARFDCGSLTDSQITDSKGETHSLSEFAVIWWRRPYGRQQFLNETHAESTQELVNHSARAHVDGLFQASFRGQLVNNAGPALRAENKMIQLQAANKVGIATPRTLFANDPGKVQDFFSDCNREAIVKSYYNSAGMQIKTTKLTSEIIAEEAPVQICPSIYQEYIPGNEHFRVVAVGNKIQAVRFTNESVDSRLDLSVPCEKHVFDEDVAAKLIAFLRVLELDMGVFDFKRDADGTLYFLEINQQGQFAYLDAVAGTNCLEMVVDYLFGTARK